MGLRVDQKLVMKLVRGIKSFSLCPPLCYLLRGAGGHRENSSLIPHWLQLNIISRKFLVVLRAKAWMG